MRYIYQEPVVTTVTDEEIVSDDDISKLFNTIKDNGFSVQMTIEEPLHPDYIKTLENVRITQIKGETIDIHAFFNGASLRYREIPFNNVRKVRLIANKQILGKKYKVSRFTQMDVAEVE